MVTPNDEPNVHCHPAPTDLAGSWKTIEKDILYNYLLTNIILYDNYIVKNRGHQLSDIIYFKTSQQKQLDYIKKFEKTNVFQLYHFICFLLVSRIREF